jgi:hypothetical protein
MNAANPEEDAGFDIDDVQDAEEQNRIRLRTGIDVRLLLRFFTNFSIRIPLFNLRVLFEFLPEI